MALMFEVMPIYIYRSATSGNVITKVVMRKKKSQLPELSRIPN
jgi:hypothetical protein